MTINSTSIQDFCVDVLCCQVPRQAIDIVHTCSVCNGCLHDVCGVCLSDSAGKDKRICHKCCIRTNTWIKDSKKRHYTFVKVYGNASKFTKEQVQDMYKKYKKESRGSSSDDSVTSESTLSTSNTSSNQPSQSVPTTTKTKSSSTSKSSSRKIGVPTNTADRDSHIIQINKFILNDIKSHGGYDACLGHNIKGSYFEGLAKRFSQMFSNEYREIKGPGLRTRFGTFETYAKKREKRNILVKMENWMRKFFLM